MLIDLLEARLPKKCNKARFNKMRYTSVLKLETKIMCRSSRIGGLSKNKERAKHNVVQISYLAFPSQDPLLKGSHRASQRMEHLSN